MSVFQGQVHQAARRTEVNLPLCLGSGSLAGRRVKGGRNKGRTECVPTGRSALGRTKLSNHLCPARDSALPFRAENSLACLSSAHPGCGLRGRQGGAEERGGVLPWVTARLSGWRVPAACGVHKAPTLGLPGCGLCTRLSSLLGPDFDLFPPGDARFNREPEGRVTGHQGQAGSRQFCTFKAVGRVSRPGLGLQVPVSETGLGPHSFLARVALSARSHPASQTFIIHFKSFHQMSRLISSF